MTSPVATDYPRSTSWQDFERLSLALFAEIHQTRFRRWGSAGQRKDGVDAWAMLSDGKVVVIRCEGRTEHFGKALTEADIDVALAELADFPHPIDQFIVLTTAPDAPGLAAYAAELTARRRGAGQSSVAVWGWQTISGHIGQHAKVRKEFYGHDVKSSAGKKLALFGAVLLVVAGGAGSLFLGKNAIDTANVKQQSATATVDDIVKSLDDLDKTYEQCLAVLGPTPYTFSHALIKNCRDPAAKALAELSKKVSKQSAGFDSQIQAELARTLVIFHEDVREAAAVTSVAHAFDNEVVRALKDGCAPGAAKGSQGGGAAVKKAGVDAVTAQVRYYFLLRDFIAPGLKTAKAILLLHARQNAEGPAREDMAAAAGRMEQLLVDRAAYTVKETRWPFALSSAKQTSARDAAPGADFTDAGEEARWRRVLGEASTESLRGRRDDVDALISCGTLKEDARALGQPPGV